MTVAEQVSPVEAIQKIIPRLAELRDLCSQIIDEKVKSKDFEHQSINWGDLACVEVRAWIDTDQEIGLTFYVEECAPDSRDFAEFIENCLVENDPALLNFNHIRVECEW